MDSSQTPYELLGGDPGVRALVDAFYTAMDNLPQAATIRRMHGDDLTPIRQKLYEFLSGWLGGPHLYLARHGTICMRGPHSPYAIGPAERDQWLMCMEAALETVQAPAAVREMLRMPLFRFADSLRNRRETATAA